MLPGLRRHPRALPAGPRHRRARACRCWTGWSSCALPEEARLADTAYAARWRAEFVGGLAERGHDDGAGLRRPLRARRRRAVRRTPPGRAAGHQRAGRQRPLPAARSCSQRRARLRRGAARWQNAGTGRGATATRSCPGSRSRATDALLDVVRDRCLRDVPGALVHLPHQRERPRRSLPSRELFGRTARTSTRYDKHGLVGRRSVLAHNVHPTGRGAGAARRAAARRSRTARPATPRSGSGLVPARTRTWPRRPRRARLGRRRRHRLLAAQGGAAGLLRAAACSATRGCR